LARDDSWLVLGFRWCQKKILFVDDDLHFLETLQELMGHYAGANWEIHLANEAAQALAVLAANPVDLLVIDVHMPVMDGLQFLGRWHRKYPNSPKVVLTGDASEPYRSACLNGGAELFLEKPLAQGGWQSVYATLDELTRMQPEEGFRGVLRRVGLQDVLQMECLGRNSSMLEIVTGEVLYEWQCANTRARIDFMNLLTDKARAMAEALSLGTFERLEIEGHNSRIITQVQPTRALFVRTSQAGVESASPRKA
jgi:CheY-like chemotaxis protein